jgi:hypothetical protein
MKLFEIIKTSAAVLMLSLTAVGMFARCSSGDRRHLVTSKLRAST